MEENRKDEAQSARDANTQDVSVREGDAQDKATPKRPRNIVTDFYDSINISVKQLDIALIVLCVFILVVIIVSAKLGV